MKGEREREREKKKKMRFLLLPDKNKGCATWDVDLNKVVAVAPRFGCREELARVADSIMSSEAGLVRVEDDLVLSRLRDADSVVCKGLCRVEVEDEHCSSTVECQYLVLFMLQ